MFMDGNPYGSPDVFCYDCGNYKGTSQHEISCLNKFKTYTVASYADYHDSVFDGKIDEHLDKSITCGPTPGERSNVVFNVVNPHYPNEVSRTAPGDTMNPKDLLGDKKVDVSQVSPFAIAHESCAMMDGSMKYGFRNWRDKKVRARVYIAACKRHLHAWEEGEETAGDSNVHHLGHARACLGILLDAQETGNLHDDRVKSNGALGRLMDRLSGWVVERKKASAALIGSNS
jgi:hypothetical protein